VKDLRGRSKFSRVTRTMLLQPGLADFNVRELPGVLISSVGVAEGHAYLSKTSDNTAQS